MMQVANNIANMSTTGFRREGTAFSEYVRDVGPGEPSLSMANATGRLTALNQGALTQTGSPLDFAIEGPGFFLVETFDGDRLTRAGNFTRSDAGDIVTPDGNRLLDDGGAPVAVPPEAAALSLGADGTLTADGQPVARIGLWVPADINALSRQDGVLFRADGIEPLEEGKILQGFIESSNVDPISEVTRMIEVQRNYELGQNFLDKEDERIRSVLRIVAAQQ